MYNSTTRAAALLWFAYNYTGDGSVESDGVGADGSVDASLYSDGDNDGNDNNDDNGSVNQSIPINNLINVSHESIPTTITIMKVDPKKGTDADDSDETLKSQPVRAAAAPTVTSTAGAVGVATSVVSRATSASRTVMKRSYNINSSNNAMNREFLETFQANINNESQSRKQMMDGLSALATSIAMAFMPPKKKRRKKKKLDEPDSSDSDSD